MPVHGLLDSVSEWERAEDERLLSEGNIPLVTPHEAWR